MLTNCVFVIPSTYCQTPPKSMVQKTLMCKSQTFDQTVSNGWCLMWTGGVGIDSLWLDIAPFWVGIDLFLRGSTPTTIVGFPTMSFFTTHKNGKGAYIYIYIYIPPIYKYKFMVMTGGWCKWHGFYHNIVVYRLMSGTALPVVFSRELAWPAMKVFWVVSSKSVAGLAGKSPNQMGIHVLYPICSMYGIFTYKTGWFCSGKL